jgi:hypothetical protein
MNDFNHPTNHLINLITNHLKGMGFTNVQFVERWDNDGVLLVTCDQSTKKIVHERVCGDKWANIRYGWHLTMSGSDNPGFDSGVDFSWQEQDPTKDKITTIQSWNHLTEVINTHK